MVINNYVKKFYEIKISLPSELNVYKALGFLGVFLTPFDSFPYFPIQTSNRPMWVIPFVVLFFYHVLRVKKVQTFVVVLAALFFYYVAKSFVLYEIYDYPNDKGLQKGIIIFVMLFSGVGGIWLYLRRLQTEFGNEGMMKHLGKVVFTSSILPITIGVMQIFGVFHVPVIEQVSDLVTNLLSYRFSAENRIQLVNGEPAWASAYLLFIFFFIYFYYDGKNKRRGLYLIVLLFLFAASALGFVYGLALAFFYIVIFAERKQLYRLLLVIILAGLVSLKIYDFLPDYTQGKIKTIIKIVSSLSFDEVLRIAANDASLLTRFLNPIIGFKLGYSSLFFGVGMEAFQYHLIDELVAMNFLGDLDEERTNTLLKAGGTPKFLLSKIFCELGLFTFLAFVGYYLYLMIKLRANKQMVFLLILSIVITYNYDSYLFYAPILCLLIGRSLTTKMSKPADA